MARAARHDWPKAAPIAANMRIVGLRDRLDIGRVESVPAADMIFMTLGKDDLLDRLAADRAQAAMIFFGTETDAGIDEYITFWRQHAIEVGHISRHIDVIAQGHCILATFPRIDDEGVERLFLISHWFSPRDVPGTGQCKIGSARATRPSSN